MPSHMYPLLSLFICANFLRYMEFSQTDHYGTAAGERRVGDRLRVHRAGRRTWPGEALEVLGTGRWGSPQARPRRR